MATAILSGALCPHPACKALGATAAWTAYKANKAASRNECLRVRYTRPVRPMYNIPVSAVIGLYSSGNKWCRD
ncbi:hypothetical protein ACGFJC_47505 [Nonomuraea fuscirosea]|uniref:hypothetical protein n=1 Tax=Nonomuraea fuscirosea TaxID=1291556 RepID=UPI003710930D